MFWEREIYLKLVVDMQEKRKQQQMQSQYGTEFHNL